MDKKNPFQLIKGGLVSEPEKPKTPVEELTETLDNLTPEQKMNLLSMMKEYFPLLLKEEASKSGRILSEQVLIFVKDHILDLLGEKPEALTEMREKFPNEEEFIINFLKDLMDSSEAE